MVDGNRLIHTPYDLSFRVERDHAVLCNKELTQKELTKFRQVGRWKKGYVEVRDMQELEFYSFILLKPVLPRGARPRAAVQ